MEPSITHVIFAIVIRVWIMLNIQWFRGRHNVLVRVHFGQLVEKCWTCCRTIPNSKISVAFLIILNIIEDKTYFFPCRCSKSPIAIIVFISINISRVTRRINFVCIFMYCVKATNGCRMCICYGNSCIV